MKQPNAVCLACRFRLFARHQATVRPPWQPAAPRFGTAAAATRPEPVDLPAPSSTRKHNKPLPKGPRLLTKGKPEPKGHKPLRTRPEPGLAAPSSTPKHHKPEPKGHKPEPVALPAPSSTPELPSKGKQSFWKVYKSDPADLAGPLSIPKRHKRLPNGHKPELVDMTGPLTIPKRHKPSQKGHKPLTWPPKADRRLERRAAKEVAAVAVFNNVVNGKAEEKDDPSRTDNPATIELYKSVATLEEMLSNSSISTAACFNYFNSDIYARISRQRAQIPRILRDRVGKELTSRVVREKAANFDSKDLPSITFISQIFLELGLFEPAAWAVLTTLLLEHICSVSTSPQDYTSIDGYETAMARRETLLHDLVGAWKMFNVPPYVAARSGDAAKAAAKASIPSLDRKKILLNTRRGKSHLSIANVFPHYSSRSLHTTIAAAIATYVLLVDPINRTNRLFRYEIEPFVAAMAAVILDSRPSRQDLGTLYAKHPALLKYMTERWPAVETQLDEQAQFQDTVDDAVDFAVDRLEGEAAVISRHMRKIHRQLGQAWNAKNLKALNRVWEEFWGPYATPTEGRAKQCREHSDLLNYFIMAYMGMRQPNRAIEVWNSMTSIGIQPTVKTWTSMMDGCKRGANLHGLKNVWAKLLASDMQLDTAVWTARVSGLIELGDPAGGIAALEEMARIWKDNMKSSKKNPAAVQPSITPVNAALAGLFRLQKLTPGAVSSLLGWAAEQGLEPDIYTFNTLLRPLLRQGLDSEVQKILATMKKNNLEANVATFTILAEGALEDIGEQPPNEQIRTVNTFLRNMRNEGITANMQLYAKMIYLLLQQGDRTEEPVKVLLAHIWSQGLELTSHIYTMLAEYYFTRYPPDADAVTALIENRRLHENKDMDWVFWERAMFGYCQVNDMARTLQIFDKIEKSGSKINPSTLYELLLMFGRSGHLEATVRLIDFVRKSKTQSDDHATNLRSWRHTRSWQHRFWHLAERYGFPREELKGEE